MPRESNSRPPSGPPAAEQTLTDLVKALETSKGLSPVRVRDLRSAISRFAALAHQEINQIPLDLQMIRAKLQSINPVAAGISQKTLANIRSDLFAAIKASGLKPTRPTKQRFAEPWRELTKQLTSKRQKIGISRLTRYASAEGLSPIDINDDVIGRFMALTGCARLFKTQKSIQKPSKLLSTL